MGGNIMIYYTKYELFQNECQILTYLSYATKSSFGGCDRLDYYKTDYVIKNDFAIVGKVTYTGRND
jgi:hypothetical protein